MLCERVWEKITQRLKGYTECNFEVRENTVFIKPVMDKHPRWTKLVKPVMVISVHIHVRDISVIDP